MTYKEIRHNEEVNELLKKGNQNLGLLGYTDHSQAHCTRVAETAAHILKKFGYPEHDIELARIAGYMHDIGNAINRNRHAEYGGLLANEILKQYDLTIPNRITIVSAISNHDESTGGAVDPISAALIIGDKTDVRRSRVLRKAESSLRHSRPRQLCGNRSDIEDQYREKSHFAEPADRYRYLQHVRIL